MSTSTLLQIFPYIILLLFFYQLWSLKGKIKCLFRQKDGSDVIKTLPIRGGYVYHNGGKYHINRKRIDIIWSKLWGFIPFPMPFQEWKWDSPEALDPKTFRNTWDTPEASNMADTEKSWRDMNQGINTEIGGKKVTGWERYLPFIAIGVTLIAVYLVWQMSGKMGIIEQQIQSLGGMINNLK